MPEPGALAAALLLAIMALIGCGGAAPPGAAPQAPESQAAPSGAISKDAEGSVAELDRAEAELDRLFGSKATKKEDAATSPAPGATPLSEGDACASACRALASMQRAATHLCELAGESDARCDDAKARVTRADQRVRGSCPACPG